MKGRAAIVVVLAAIGALVLSASAAAAPPFPKIKRGHELSCSGAKAKVSVAIAWKKANRRGEHRGHAVLLLKGKKSGEVLARKLSSKRLRDARTHKISYRFRFGERASKRLCKGKAKAEVVASHGHNKDGQGPVEIYRLTRKTLGGKASASREVGAAGPLLPGSDCLGGGAKAIIKADAQLQFCDLSGADLSGAVLSNANLTGANLTRANLFGANLSGAVLSCAFLSCANLSGANLSTANLSGADLSGAVLTDADLSGTNPSANLTGADLTGADLSGANLSFAILTGANCSGAIKPDGSTYPTGSGFPLFFPC